MADNYSPATSRSLYNPDSSNAIARLWAREKTLHDFKDFGAVDFFEGPGTNPTVLSGYATNKLWLRVDDGVTSSVGTVRYYAGGDATLLASWPELDREGFSAHIGARSGSEFDFVWSSATSGDPGTGKVRGNNATLSSITEIAISKTGRQNQSYGSRIATWQSSDIVRVYTVGNESLFVDVAAGAAPVDNGTYYTVSCTVRASSSLTNGDLVGVGHWPTSLAIDAAAVATAQAAIATAQAALAAADALDADAARVLAQSARDAAFSNAGVYADITTGRAAVADNQQFMVVAGAEIVRYRRDSSSTQTELARYPTSTGVKLARGLISGRITVLTWSSTPFGSDPTVTLSAGKAYRENNSGNFFKKIAAVAATTLSTGEGIMVDLDAGSTDGTGAYIPVKANIASGLQTGWQSIDKHVLVARDPDGTLFGEYVNSTPDLANAGSVAEYARKFLTVTVTVNADGTLDFSYGALWRENNSGAFEIGTMQVLGATALGSNECYVIDPAAGPFDSGSGKPIPTKFAIASGLAPRWQSRNAHVVIAKDSYGNYSSPCGASILYAAAAVPDTVTVIKSGTSCKVYSPINGAQSAEFQFVNTVNAGTRVDVWRCGQVWLSTGVAGSFTPVRPFVDEGELECAVLLNGGTDYMGGLAHGDQTKTFAALLSGASVVSSDGSTTAGEFHLVQRSQLTDPDAVGNPVRFYLDTEHIVRSGGRMTVRGTLTAVGTPQVSATYLGMLKACLTYLASNVMTSAYLDEPWSEFDLTGTVSNQTTRGRSVHYRGSNGMWMRMVDVSPPLASRRLYLEGSGPKGKTYNNHTGAGVYTFSNGERIEFQADYTFGVS